VTSTQPPSNYRVSTKALITDAQGRLLLVREDDDPWWGLPGGGLEHGENIAQGLKRELMEEVGAELASFGERAEFAWTFYFDPKDVHNIQTELPGYKLWLVYRARLKTEPKPTQHEVRWFAKADIKKGDWAPYVTDSALRQLLAFLG
jgi:8-oxo-dGTP pyrophosphatase MutT (NUDIX family)